MDGCHNPIVRSTPADIAFQGGLDLLVGRRRILSQQSYARQNHAWRAIAALHRIAIDKALLNRVQAVTICQSFDRCNLMSVSFPAGDSAGVARCAVQKHGAGPTLAFATTVLRASQIKFIAQNE